MSQKKNWASGRPPPNPIYRIHVPPPPCSDEETVYSTYSKTPMDESDYVDRNGAVAMVHERPGGGGDLLYITF